MRLLFVFLLFLIPIDMLAAESIYTWGYGQQAHGVLKSIEMMTGGSGGDAALKLVAALGLFVTAFRTMIMGKDNVLQEITKYLVIVVVVGYMFWISKHQYLVEDQINFYTSPSPLTLPVGVGTTMSIFSGLEKGIGEGMEKYFSTPTSIGIMKQGLGFQMNVNLTTNAITLQESSVIRSFNEYIGNCVLPAVDAGNVRTETIINSDNLINALKINNSLLTNVYAANGTSTTMECNLAWDAISLDVVADYPNMLSTVAALTPGGTNASFSSDVGTVFRTMYNNAAASAQNGMIQASLKNGLSSGIEAAALATGGSAGNLAVAKAMTDQSLKSGWSQAGIAAQKTLPLQKAVFTLVLMGLIVFMALMSIVFVTMQYVKTIFMLFAVLVMWNPIAAIINFLISMQMDSVAQQVLVANATVKLYPTYMNSNVISGAATDYMAFLGFFGTLIPMFSYMIVKGGDSIASQMYSSIAGGMSMAARSGAALGALGNAQVGNVSAGNRQFGNESVGSKSSHISNQDGSMSRETVDKKGLHKSRTDPETGAVVEETLGNANGAPKHSTLTENSAGTVAAKYEANGHLSGLQGTAISTANATKAYSEGKQRDISEIDQKIESTAKEQMKTIASAINLKDSDTKSLNTLRSMGYSVNDSNTILSNVKEMEKYSAGHNAGTGSGTAVQSSDVKTVASGANITGTVTAGTPASGIIGSSAKLAAAGSVAIGNQQGDGVTANTSTTSTSSSGHEKMVATSLDESAAHVVGKNETLTKALSHVHAGTKEESLNTSQAEAVKTAQTLSSAISTREAATKALQTTEQKTADVTLAAANDYFDRLDPKKEMSEAAKGKELERLNNSFANGRGADEVEWNRSLDRAAEKLSGLEQANFNVDEKKLEEKARGINDTDYTPLDIKHSNVTGDLTTKNMAPINAEFKEQVKGFEKPGATPKSTNNHLVDKNSLKTTVEIHEDNNAAAVDKQKEDHGILNRGLNEAIKNKAKDAQNMILNVLK